MTTARPAHRAADGTASTQLQTESETEKWHLLLLALTGHPQGQCHAHTSGAFSLACTFPLRDPPHTPHPPTQAGCCVHQPEATMLTVLCLSPPLPLSSIDPADAACLVPTTGAAARSTRQQHPEGKGQQQQQPQGSYKSNKSNPLPPETGEPPSGLTQITLTHPLPGNRVPPPTHTHRAAGPLAV